MSRTAVITGASRGIGKAIALKLAQNGINVAVIYHSSRDAAEVVRGQAEGFGVKAVAYQCDAADAEAVKTVCERITAEFGGVDILVNDAGVTKDNLLMRMSEADFDSVINVNLKGVFYFTKYLSRAIMKSGCGRIINISSVIGMMGNAGQANYAAAKAGIIGLTKSAAREFASRNVTCNAIAPGFIETDMTAVLAQSVKDGILGQVPLKRMGSPDDVAALAVFLASEAASYITGEVIKVDGGLYI